jgi:hypothetical protein
METMAFTNGDVYVGYVKDGKKHGTGRFTWANGDVYDGSYVNDAKSGLGKLRYANGDVFEGHYVGGKKSGTGKYCFANGCRYEGHYLDNSFHGFGTFMSSDGWVYEGQWAKGKANGRGKLRYANGDVYVGLFRGDRRHGAGCMVFADGSRYEGGFVNDEKSGSGTLTHADGRTDTGVFEGDVFLHSKVQDQSALSAGPDDAGMELSSPTKMVAMHATGSDAHTTLALAQDSVALYLKICLEKLAPSLGAGSSHPPAPASPLPPSQPNHTVNKYRPMHQRAGRKQQLSEQQPSEQQPSEKQPSEEKHPDAPESGDLAVDTDINDIFSSLLKDFGDRYNDDDSFLLTDQDNAANLFPKKSSKHQDDIRLGKAITKLLGDKEKLTKYLKPESAFLSSNDSTIALMQRIRRELNLPGNKGVDPKSRSISSDLEKELIDEDIAYVDEMALDYNSFILVNKEASANAAWSGVELPKLGSSVFKNLANESSMLKHDPMALSPLVQSAVSAAGVASPLRNDWMDIFDGTAPSATARREEQRMRKLALNKKSPYYQSAKTAKKLHVSKSSESFLKVGNPCSAANMRSRKINSSGGSSTLVHCTALHATMKQKLNGKNGTPTLQSTMKMKAKDDAFVTFELLVPKTQNGLKIQFSNQSGASKIRKSLVIKGFSPDSNVKKQGILQVGDEILEVNSYAVRGKYIDDITGVIARDKDAFVLVLVRRPRMRSLTEKSVEI